MPRVLLLVWLLMLPAIPALAQLQIVPQQQQAVLGQAGIGAVLNTRNGAPVISQVIPHSPAEGASLKTADTIVWVNYRDVAGMKLEDVVSLIRGDTGSSVVITVRRVGDPKPHSYTMTRAPITFGP